MADTGAKLTPGLVGVPPAARPGIWAAFWGWLHSPRQRLLFKRAIAAWGTLFSFAFLRLPVVVAVVWVGVLLLTSLTERTTAIEPISVPKALADRGYTPEVAAYRLRDALNQFAGDALNRPSGYDAQLQHVGVCRSADGSGENCAANRSPQHCSSDDRTLA